MLFFVKWKYLLKDVCEVVYIAGDADETSDALRSTMT